MVTPVGKMSFPRQPCPNVHMLMLITSYRDCPGNKQLKRLRATRYLLNSKETRRKYVLFTSIVAYRNTNRSECDVHRGERTFDTVYSYSRSLSLSGL